jgi:RHS repeat-associated protein
MAAARKYTGKERDQESGLDYFGARYYGSSLGRFTSPDPLLSSARPGNPQTWNRYAYVRNNPLGRIDPTGLYDFKNTCGSTDKACNAAFAQTQTNVRNAYKATQAAYEKAAANGDTKQAAALKRTLDGLGAEGQKNARGQTVNISVNLGQDAPGLTSFAKGSTSTINVVLNPGMSGSDDSAQVAVVHEGVRAGEITPGSPTFNKAFGLEHDAYETESYFSQAIGHQDIHTPSDGSDMVNGVLDMSRDFVLWNPSWATLDAATIDSNRSSGVNAAAKDGANADCKLAGGCKP